MNKYYIKIPYSYMKYGELSCFVYAEDEEEAKQLAKDYDERYGEDYNDDNNDGDTNYNFSDMDIETDEEDVDEDSFDDLPERIQRRINGEDELPQRVAVPSAGTTNPFVATPRRPMNSREALEDLFEDVSKL